MMNANVEVKSSRNHSSLSVDDCVLAHGMKISNLFAYNAIPSVKPMHKTIDYSSKPLAAHPCYNTLEKMSRLQSAEGFSPDLRNHHISQCINCPFGKQTQHPFSQIERIPDNIGDIIASDICGPFELSIGGYKYFITWIELKSRYKSVNFLKNKECSTVTESLKRLMACY